MMSQRFFLVPSVRFGLGFVVFSTLWKQHGNLLLNGEFQMPFQSLHGAFSRPAQGMGVTLGSLSLRWWVRDGGHVNKDGMPGQTNTGQARQWVRGFHQRAVWSGLWVNKAGKFFAAVPRSRGRTFGEAQHKMAGGLAAFPQTEGSPHF